MDKELESSPSAGLAASEQAKPPSVDSDLQYISIELDGKTYGGWYRVLADGQMELFALANVHCELRPENTPIEQARGMLTDFIRAARLKSKTNESAAGTRDARSSATRTLGDLLYADQAKSRVSEKDWVSLVQSIAAGEQLALGELYQRTHRLVFTLIMRLVNSRQTAEELTLDVFRDMPRHALHFDAAGESVVGWIMNQARSRATDHLVFERDQKRVNVLTDNPLSPNAASDSDEVREITDQGHPIDVLRPSAALWERLAQRIAAETGCKPMSPATPHEPEPEWEEVAPGISCRLLATDSDMDRVSMLVRLAPGVEYPPHRHAGVEELHLLHGELWIDDRKLHPGDYTRAQPGTADKRVWSESGCTCVLMTSARDVIG